MITILLFLIVVCIFLMGYSLGHIKGYQEATDIAIKELDKLYKKIEGVK